MIYVSCPIGLEAKITTSMFACRINYFTVVIMTFHSQETGDCPYLSIETVLCTIASTDTSKVQLSTQIARNLQTSLTRFTRCSLDTFVSVANHEMHRHYPTFPQSDFFQAQQQHSWSLLALSVAFGARYLIYQLPHKCLHHFCPQLPEIRILNFAHYKSSMP